MPNYVIQLIVRGSGAEKSVDGVTKRLTEADRAARRLNQTMSSLVTLMTGAQFIKLADTYTSITNKLRTVSNGHDDLAGNMQRTFKLAQNNRVAWETLANTYSRIHRSTTQLRLSQQQVADVTDTLAKAIKLSGATTAEANSVMIQFGQALSKGKLDGDEFKSIMENSVEVGNLLTKSLGVTRGELMRMSKAGKLTTDVIIKAFQEGRKEIVDRFGQAIPTIAERFTVLRNAVVKALGEAVAPLSTLGKMLSFVTDNAAALTQAALYLGATVLGVKLVQGAMSAVKAMQALRVAMLANPYIAVAAGVAALAVALGDLGEGVKKTGLGTKGEVLSGDDPIGANKLHNAIAVMQDLEENLRRVQKATAEALDVTPMERFIEWMRKLAFASDAMRATAEANVMVAAALIKGKTESIIKMVEDAVKKAEQARKEAEAFRKQFESFQGSLSPAAQAAFELANGLDMINEALRRNLIDVANAEILYERLRESIAGVNQVAADRTGGFVDIANEDGFGSTRVQTAPTFLPSTSLGKAGIERTDLLLGQDADRIRATNSPLFQDSLSEQKRILDELRGPEQDRINRLVAMNKLLADQKISQAEYNKLLEDMTKKDMVEGIKKLDQEFVLLFGNMEDALADFLYTGEFGFKKMVDSMLRDISRLLAQQVILGALGYAGGAGYGNAIATGAAMMGSYATGGEFTVPSGNPGVDKTMVAFRATPGERVSIQTTAQQARAARGGGGGTTVKVINPFDPRSVPDMLNTPAGRRAMADAVRQNPSIVSRRTK